MLSMRELNGRDRARTACAAPGSPPETKPGLAPDEASEIQLLLRAIKEGERDALTGLIPLAYETLKQIAQWQVRKLGSVLEPTELVHEAYLKLASVARPDWQDESHFFGVAARAMRQVLIDGARKASVDLRREQEMRALSGEENIWQGPWIDELVTLGAALRRLGETSERLRRIVEYHYFVGLSTAEIAEQLGVSMRTVERDLVRARLRLQEELYPASE
jgi:RNA polymerase sigma factor (TIGR02999 family)